MTNVLAWIAEHLWALWPIRIIHRGQQGVHLRRDGSVARLAPGLRWFLPALESIEPVHVAYQEVDCAIQTVETLDEVAVTFSANVGFEIADAAAMWTDVYHLDATLERAARGYLGGLITGYAFNSLHDNLDDIADTAREDLQRLATPWGVKIVRIRFTDFVRTKQFRLYTGQATAPLGAVIDL